MAELVDSSRTEGRISEATCHPATLLVRGHTFRFRVAEHPRLFLVECGSPEDILFPLCVVLKSLWNYSPLDFLRATLDHHGLSMDGVEFAYDHGPEGVLADGPTPQVDVTDKLSAVRLRFLKEILYVSVELWHGVLVGYIQYGLEAASQVKRKVKDEETIRTLTQDLQASLV